MKLKIPLLCTTNKRPFFISLLFFVFCVMVTEIAIYRYQQNEQHKQFIYTKEVSDSIQSTILASINDTFHLYGLRAYLVAKQGKVQPDELNAILANYFPKIGPDQLIRNIDVAPDNQIQYLYPLTGNEKALGLRLIDVPKQWPLFERAIQEKQSVLIGPTDLVQGVSGLIYSVPVFLADNYYWGMLNVVINADHIFDFINDKMHQQHLQVAIRGRNASGERGEVFWGDATLFGGEGVRSTIKVPSGSWQLIVKPAAMGTSLTWIVYLTPIVLAALVTVLLFNVLTASCERRKNTEKFSKIASQLPGMVFQFCLRSDGSSYFPYVSEAIRDIYRLSPEEVSEDASKVFAILHPDDYDDINASIQNSVQDLRPWHCEYRIKFDDGTERWLLGNALLQKEVDGSTLWHGFITDITERKQTELEHEKLLTSFQKISSLVPGMIFEFHLRLDGSSYFPFVSQGIKDLYHLSPEDVSYDASKLFALCYPDDIRNLEILIEKSAQTLSPFNYEFRVQLDDGSLRWILAKSIPQREADGSTLWYGFNTDITERKLLEQNLTNNKQLLRNIIDSTPSSIFAFDLDHRVILLNDTMSQFYGMPKEEILGKTLHDVFQKDIAPKSCKP